MDVQQKLHFVLVPFMAQGHMIPMVDIAWLLADRGVTVTLVTTPFNARRIETIIEHVKQSNLPIKFVVFDFPSSQVGLPEGCENVDVLPSRDLLTNFFEAMATLKQPLRRYLQLHQLPLSCIISDNCHSWTRDVALEFGVPRFIFHGTSCFALFCLHTIRRNKTTSTATVEPSDVLILRDMPHPISVTAGQVSGFFNGKALDDLRKELREIEATADGVIVNSFDGLEQWYVEKYQSVTGKKIWTIGPVSHCNKDAMNRASRGNKSSIDETTCGQWLDSMKANSVLYISFGSLARTPPSQIVEIAHGLESSNHPFLWVIKSSDEISSFQVEKFLSEGFEQRNKHRCLIIRGWAPQVTILTHPAIGGFLTHAGWNSTLEAISAGVPMATWPHFAEQFLNSKFVVDVLCIGVEVEGLKSCVAWGEEESSWVLVRREQIKSAILRLMNATEEANLRRRRAFELGALAHKAMHGGGSSYENMSSLIKHVASMRNASTVSTI